MVGEQMVGDHREIIGRSWVLTPSRWSPRAAAASAMRRRSPSRGAVLSAARRSDAPVASCEFTASPSLSGGGRPREPFGRLRLRARVEVGHNASVSSVPSTPRLASSRAIVCAPPRYIERDETKSNVVPACT